MNNDSPPFTSSESATIDKRDDAQFQHEVKRLIEKAEAKRIVYMNKHQLYKMISITVGMIIILVGSSGFGWFLLMDVDLSKAFASLIIAISIPLFLHGWVQIPVKHYLQNYKKNYLPELAALIGGFSYHETRGVNEKILRKTGCTPPFSYYECEDCFRGHYKGTKILFSEAKLKDKQKKLTFNGLFVLIEIPHKVFEGHTIITADRDMADEYAPVRWGKLQKIPLTVSTPEWDRFVAYSDKPEANSLVLGEKLLKELAEADMAFGNANLTAVLFRGKYIFLMIPHEKNMFEASDIYVPISSHNHTLACKKEIEQLLEVIDVFDLYTPKS